MGVGGMLLTHLLVTRDRKDAFFFSRFNFTRMKERGNTHYCFHCGGDVGFRPVRVGKLIKRKDIRRATNQLSGRGYDAMKHHDATHANGVIGNASRYRNVWDWLEREIGKKKDFPFVVSVPAID